MTQFLILAILFLNGCSPYADQFMCKPQSGMYCSSVSEVNKQIDHNPDLKKTNKKINPSLKSLNHINTDTKFNGISRSKDKTLRIWLAGFKVQDFYIEEQYVHKVIEPSNWVVK
jgi:hypothetical protein